MNEQRPNSGILFTNYRKQSERSPEFSGDCNIGGVTYKIAGWNKKGKKTDFVSLAFKPADEEPRGYASAERNAPSPATSESPAPAQAGDDIPF